MKIAMVGSRGFNADYGGIETMLSELCPRLVKLGCTVDVFSRSNVCTAPSALTDLRAIPVGSIGGKHFENLTRSGFATIRALGRYDIIHFHAIGPGVLSVVTACARQRSVVTVHALDYNREKWGRAAKAALKLAERTSVLCADHITAVAPTIRQHFNEAYGRDVTLIPNGVKNQPRRPSGPALASLGLTSGYLLFAGRLTPEKGCEDLIKAFNHVPSNRQLVIAGEAVERLYSAKLRKMADPAKIIFVGHQKGNALAELFSNAYLHVLPARSEGYGFMAIGEALGYRLPSLTSDILPNRDFMGHNGFYFKPGDIADLSRTLVRLITQPQIVREMATSLGTLRMTSWDQVAQSYLSLYQAAKSRSRVAPPCSANQ
jgi:glycosyltransferase involved in cell wall biosynthesis